MKDTIIETLMYLFEHHIQNADTDAPPSLTHILKDMTDAGFENHHVMQALSWMNSFMTAKYNTEDYGLANCSAARLYTDYEREFIGPECIGHIMHLEQLNILTPVTRERVIDRILDLEPGDVGIPELKWITLLVLYDTKDAQAQLAQLESWILNSKEGTSH